MARHILQFNFIKFVRWTIVPGLDGEQLNYPYLFFESNFDGPWQHYIDAFAYVIPLRHPRHLGARAGLPGAAAGRAAEGLDRDELHGGRHVLLRARRRLDAEVNNALAVRERFERCGATPDGCRPEEFKAAWERFLTDAQAHL